MKIMLFVFFLFLRKEVSSQDRITVNVIGFHYNYELTGNKIIEIVRGAPEKQIASIRGNKIYKENSLNENDILYTILDSCVYKTSLCADSNLLCYLKGNFVLLRTKKGKFEIAGEFTSSTTGRVGLLSYLDPLEYFAILIAGKKIY